MWRTEILSELQLKIFVFRGDDYKEHVRCVSEDQKYGGRNFEAKTNKGDAKQQEWIQVRFAWCPNVINN